MTFPKSILFLKNKTGYEDSQVVMPTQKGRYMLSRFVAEAPEAQRSKVTDSGTECQEVAELGFVPGCYGLRVHVPSGCGGRKWGLRKMIRS